MEMYLMSLGKIKVETSARHVHLTTQDVETLFGKDATLTPKRDLSQPGQFLSEERVRIEGPKGGFDRTAILGPERKATQVEVSLTDARILGVEAPIRESGDVAGSAPIRIIGPNGQIVITEGVIVAKRHIHVTPEDAAAFGIKDKQIVKVKVGGDRGLIFDEVVIRVSPSFKTFMHIDFDEANAAAISGLVDGEILA
jgi:putative phosphotransacetylase